MFQNLNHLRNNDRTWRHIRIDKTGLQQIYMYGEILAVDGGMNNINTWSSDVDCSRHSVFISICITPDNELFTVKYTFNLETLIYIGT